jgi:hypothetical protein
VSHGIFKETDLFHRFVDLANWSLDQYEINARDVRFCRNDPVLVLDSDGGRKPDVVIVHLATVDKEGRHGVDAVSKEGPKMMLCLCESTILARMASVSVFYVLTPGPPTPTLCTDKPR